MFHGKHGDQVVACGARGCLPKRTKCRLSPYSRSMLLVLLFFFVLKKYVERGNLVSTCLASFLW